MGNKQHVILSETATASLSSSSLGKVPIYNIDTNDFDLVAGREQFTSKYLISGGASWSGTGLVYDVTALEYYFNGDKTASATQVTLDASDPVNNRLDAIVVDEAGVVSVIKGDASASPISPSVDESHILVQYILVEAGTTEPAIVKEDIYLENAEWTTSTYTTGTATGSIDFDNAVSPKQGVKCISANADARLGARFVRTTSFDPYQYTMLSMWVRFTGSNVATNKSLNVRFENGAGTLLVANTINLFNFGLQRNLLNVWQLVVIPITSFGVLPPSVKGLKIIMTGGTVGQARQWDIDLISLTDNSVPAINEQAFNVLKDGALVGQSSSLNFKGGSVNVTKDAIGGKIDIEVIGGGSPAGSDTQIQYNNAGAFGASSDLIWDNTNKLFIAGDFGGTANHTYIESDDTSSLVVANGLKNTVPASTTTPVFTGSGLDDLTTSGSFTGLTTITYTITVASSGTPDTFDWSDTNGGSGTGVSMSTSPILLSNGVEVIFGSDTGHTVSNIWTFDGVPAVTTYGQMLKLDGASQAYRFGDVDDVSNKAKLEILGGSKPKYTNYFNDNGSFRVVGSLNSQEYLSIDGSNNEAIFKLSSSFKVDDTTGGGATTHLLVDTANEIYSFGKPGITGAETIISLDNSYGSAYINSPNQCEVSLADGQLSMLGGTSDSRTYFQGKIAGTGFKTGLDLDYKNNLYRIGDIDSANNSTLISVNDTIGDITLQSNGAVRIGSISGGNNTKITIDDTAQTINFNNNYSFPFADGAAGQVLGTDGSGQLGWQSVSGGGGQIAFTKTKAEIDALILYNDLVAGALYEITGVHLALYDDGTTSGTTIYLRAINSNTLEVQGMGKFYNPKYNQSVDGFGIWDNKMYGTFSNIVGIFDYQIKEAVTANNAATGIILADGMIQWVSGDWSAATSIAGDVSGATADVAGFVSPSYGVGDKVIWGGYSWTNANGNVGASVDVLNLNAEWTKNVYDTTNYNVSYDVIEYDYANDFIVRRYNEEANIDVKCSKAQYDILADNGFIFHAISVQQWGNNYDLLTYKGQLNIIGNGGYNESVNFSGSYQSNLTFGNGSSQSNLTFGDYSSQSNLTFGNNSSQSNLTFGNSSSQSNLTFGNSSSQSNLTFGNSSSQSNLTFGNDSYQSYLTFGNDSYQSYLTFGNSSSQYNLTFGNGSSQSNLTFGNGSSQYNLTFGQNSYQNNLTFGQSSSQSDLTFGQNSYQYNLTFGESSSQYNLTFGASSYQGNLTFGESSSQYNLTFGNDSYQSNLTFGNSSLLDYNSQVISSNMQYITFNTKNITVPDLSSATLLFDGNIKEVYQRPDGALKIRYYDNSDALVIANIAD